MINMQWALALSCWMYSSRNKTIPTLNCSKQHLWICLSNRLMSFWNVHFIPLLLWAPKSKCQLVPLWSVIKKSVPLFKFDQLLQHSGWYKMVVSISIIIWLYFYTTASLYSLMCLQFCQRCKNHINIEIFTVQYSNRRWCKFFDEGKMYHILL